MKHPVPEVFTHNVTITGIRESLDDHGSVEIPLSGLPEFEDSELDEDKEALRKLIRSRCFTAGLPLRGRTRTRTTDRGTLVVWMDTSVRSQPKKKRSKSKKAPSTTPEKEVVIASPDAQPVASSKEDEKPPRKPSFFYSVLGILHAAEIEGWVDYEIAEAVLELVEGS